MYPLVPNASVSPDCPFLKSRTMPKSIRKIGMVEQAQDSRFVVELSLRLHQLFATEICLLHLFNGDNALRNMIIAGLVDNTHTTTTSLLDNPVAALQDLAWRKFL